MDTPEKTITLASQFVYALLRNDRAYEFLYGIIGLIIAFFALVTIQVKQFNKPQKYIYAILLATISSFDLIHLLLLSNRFDWQFYWKTYVDFILNISIGSISLFLLMINQD